MSTTAKDEYLDWQRNPKRSEKGFSQPYGGYGTFGGLRVLLPGAEFDYRADAGELWLNSTISICLNFIFRCFPESPFSVFKRQDDGLWKPDEDNEWRASQVLEPNRDYGHDLLIQASIISLVTSGNNYIFRTNPSVGGELFYIPHYLVRPVSSTQGGFIDYYEYISGTRTYKVQPKNILHTRIGADPANIRLGLSPVGALLREVCGDNGAATFSASLLRNFGVPGVILSPDGVDISPDDADAVKQRYKSEFTRDGAGKVMMATTPVKLSQISLTPKDMDVSNLQQMFYSKICAAVGLDPMVVGLPSAQKTYSNFEEARDAAWENCIIPMQSLLARSLTSSFPALVDNKVYRYGYDLRNVRALSEDENKKAKRIKELAGGPVISVNEGRAELGKGPVDGGDTIREPKGGFFDERNENNRDEE